mgnify:CR=1 FL=1
MQYVRIIRHKGNYFYLYEHKGIYLHPFAGINLFPRGKGIKKWPYERLCSYITLKKGLNKKCYSRFVRKFQNEDNLD